MPPRESVLDKDVLPLNVTQFAQSLPKGVDFQRELRSAVKQETNPGNSRRLRTRRERPREGEQRRRHVQAERLGGLDVDGQLEFGRLQHRQIGRLLPLENAADIGAHLTERILSTGVVAH
jgi:hypothetical protein